MSRYNLFPRILAGRSVSLLTFCSLSTLLFAATAADSFGQSRSGRPVARMITAERQYESPQMRHAGRAIAATAVTESRVSSPAPAVSATSLERRAFDLVNVERARNGLRPLVWDGSLCRVSRLHSEKMARQNFFNHVAPDGADPAGRLRSGGIVYRSMGENLAFNQGANDPVTSAVNQWMNSPKHRANIMREHFTHSAIGIGRSADGGVYLTQVFIMR